MKKFLQCIVIMGILLSLYDITIGYIFHSGSYEIYTKEMYTIYEELPIPEKTNELMKKETVRKRHFVSLDVDYCTYLSDTQIRDFYIERLPLNGWHQIEDLGGDGIAFTRSGWKVSIHNENEKYNLYICKSYAK